MKTLTKFKSKWRFTVAIIFLLPLLGGCQEEGLPDEEGAEVSLNRFPDNPAYASLPLIGTKWKLIGFVDGKKNRIRLAKPGGGDSYTLIFKEQGVLDGYASTNRIRGDYIMESERENRVIITYFGLVTYINEVYDGPLYLESMKKVNYSRISSKGLELHYEPRKHLLFKPSNLNFLQ